ncbi:MAG TPA: molybdopterin-dependent oxidoreductase, partial [Acidimicrobiales bacterium]|nr:molybdopterin-dependent oxidoreductase [Acidimicrobiales bacterium]
FSRDVSGDPLISFIGRGGQTQVNTFPDHPFASYFSGNTVQICPVGALLAKPYRFRARPWDLEQVESTCQVCAVGCRMAVQSSNDRLTRYLGVDSDPVNHGWLCDKGRFSFEAVNSDKRLGQPMLRQGDTLVPGSWGEALDAAAEGIDDALRGYGPGGVAVLGGARLHTEDAYAWAKLAKGVVGTDSVDCQLGDGLPAEVVLGLPRATIDDACSATSIVLLAPDLKEELPVLYLRLRGAAVDGKVPVIEISSRSTGLTRYATAVLPYRPGEAAAVARALARGEAGTTAGEQAAIGNGLLGERPVVVLGRPSVATGAGGMVEAAAALAEIPGVRFLSALRRGNVHGALDVGLAPGLLPGRVSLEAGRDWFTEAWGTLPDRTGLDATEMLRAAAAGEIQALVLLGSDPLSDFPDRDLARQALEQVPFVVAVDTFLNESVRMADVVLPAAMFAERPGTTTNLEGRVSRLGAKITAPDVAWPDWMIAVELAARLGGDLGFGSLDDVWDEMERLAPAFAGVTREVLASREHRNGIVLPLTGPQPEAAPGIGTGSAGAPDASQDPTATPGILAGEDHGAIEAQPSDAAPAPEPAPAAGRPALLRWSGPAEPMRIPKPDAYALRLVVGRKLYDRGVLVGMSPSLAPLPAEPVLKVHPSDLDRLGVRSGGQVRLRSARVTATIVAQADDHQPRGTASIPFNVDGLDTAALLSSDEVVTQIAIETL